MGHPPTTQLLSTRLHLILNSGMTDILIPLFSGTKPEGPAIKHKDQAMRVLGLGAQTTDMGGTKQVIYFGLRCKILKDLSRSPCQNIPIIRYKKHIIVRFPLVKLRQRPSWKFMSHSKYIQGGNQIAIKSMTLLLV